MKMKFWEKEEEDDEPLDDVRDPMTKDFGGPGLPKSQPEATREPEISESFASPYQQPKNQFDEQRRDNSKEELIEAKLDAVKSKVEILDHKLDKILERLKDVY